MNTDFEYKLSHINEEQNLFIRNTNKKLSMCLILFSCCLPLLIIFLRILSDCPYLSSYYIVFVTITVAVFLFSIIYSCVLYFKVYSKKRTDYLNEFDRIIEDANNADYKFISTVNITEERIKITILTLILCALIILAVVISSNAFSSFTIEKWQNNQSLRPYITYNFIRLQRKYNLSLDYIEKEDEPDFLGFYSREEIINFFDSEKKNNPSEDINIKYSTEFNKNNYPTDVFYAYTDINGKDYWLLITYVKKEDSKYHFGTAQIMPSGNNVVI